MADIFEVAMKAYDDVINDLIKATNSFKKYADSRNIDYNPRITLNQFDILLQYSMMQLALTDTYLDKGEINFIKDITKYSDFCVFLRKHGLKEVTWEVLYRANEEDLIELLNRAKNDIIELSQDFIKIFTVYDCLTEHDYLQDLKINIRTIMLAVCKADGYVNEEELRCGFLFLSVIDQIEKGKKIIDNNTSEPKTLPHKTLKDFYVKKN